MFVIFDTANADVVEWHADLGGNINLSYELPPPPNCNNRHGVVGKFS